MEFGSTDGGWVYPYLHGLSAQPFLIFGLLLPALLYFLHLTHKYIASHERVVVTAWILGGFAFQACLHSLCPYSLGDIVESDQANAFYGVTIRCDAGQLLRNFHAAVGDLPLHAKANMPGKILLYYGLELATRSPQALAYLIMLLSDLGGVLVYLVVDKLFANRTSAVYAMILYLLIPAKTFFFPLLNTVTPVFLFLSLLLLLLYLESGRRVYLVFEGVSLYALVLFEPLPLVAGVVFLAVLARAYAQKQIGKTDLAIVVAVVAGSFLLCHSLMVFIFEFDVIRSFLFAWNDAREFNAAMGRPYSVWVVHNLKDFLLNAGLIPSALFVGVAAYRLAKLLWICRTGAKRGQRVKAFLTQPETVLTMSFLVVLLLTDLVGVNRGETVRLWIFLAVFVQIIAAHFCATRAGRWAFTSVAALTVLQTAVTISMVGFVIVEPK
jgi:hypothetical protein